MNPPLNDWTIPPTLNTNWGDVVPIPTLPVGLIRMRSKRPVYIATYPGVAPLAPLPPLIVTFPPAAPAPDPVPAVRLIVPPLFPEEVFPAVRLRLPPSPVPV